MPTNRRLDFVIWIIVDDSGTDAATWWDVTSRHATSDTGHLWLVVYLVFFVPQSVAFDREPCESEDTSYDHANPNNESGKSTWIPFPSSG